MREDKNQKPQKTGTVANPGQPLTGNKNQGDDLEEIIPREPLSIDRPTRDDGDNDDEGALGSGRK